MIKLLLPSHINDLFIKAYRAPLSHSNGGLDGGNHGVRGGSA